MIFDGMVFICAQASNMAFGIRKKGGDVPVTGKHALHFLVLFVPFFFFYTVYVLFMLFGCTLVEKSLL